jgi:hypothetical protein
MQLVFITGPYFLLIFVFRHGQQRVYCIKKKAYSFYPPMAPSTSSDKPRLDNADYVQLEPVSYIKISSYSCQSVSPSVEEEYIQNMQDQETIDA